jgi:hypothetical protein
MAMGEEIRAVLDVLSLLTPYDVPGCTRRRYGNPRGDGGYVLLEDLLHRQTVISAGVGDQVSFDLALADRGHDVLMFDHTVAGPPREHPRFRFRRQGLAPPGEARAAMTSLDAIVDELGPGAGDLIVKMDIEGAEWSVLAAVPDAVLGRFAMIVLEVHGLDAIGEEAGRVPQRAVLGRLAAGFTLFHVHANNFATTKAVRGLPVHPVMELCYARNDLVRRAPNRSVFPSAFDAPNSGTRPDTALWFHPFLPTACPPEVLHAELRRCALQLDMAEELAAARRNAVQLRGRVQALQKQATAPEDS